MTDTQKLQAFTQKIWEFYSANKREFAWRSNPSEYNVFVSEIMLQQTQTFRIIDKFELFVTTFPDFKTLADAPFVEVLRCWKGLGYNRRAKFIQQTAQLICSQHHGKLPASPAELVKLPGIGPATSCSITTFAFNTPTTFIETNVRTVFLHEFFSHQTKVPDKDLLPLVIATVDPVNPREWYYALMDYGVFLKKEHKNPSRKSKHHVKQSRFEGSDRQIRGKILELLLALGPCSFQELAETLKCEEERLQKIIDALVSENFITENTQGRFTISQK